MMVGRRMLAGSIACFNGGKGADPLAAAVEFTEAPSTEVGVAESVIWFIRTSGRVEVQLGAYPGETFRGKAARISDTVDPQTRTLKGRAAMVNAGGRFRPEMFARIRHIESTRRRPVVAARAVSQAEGRSFV